MLDIFFYNDHFDWCREHHGSGTLCHNTLPYRPLSLCAHKTCPTKSLHKTEGSVYHEDPLLDFPWWLPAHNSLFMFVPPDSDAQKRTTCARKPIKVIAFTTRPLVGSWKDHYLQVNRLRHASSDLVPAVHGWEWQPRRQLRPTTLDGPSWSHIHLALAVARAQPWPSPGSSSSPLSPSPPSASSAQRAARRAQARVKQREHLGTAGTKAGGWSQQQQLRVGLTQPFSEALIKWFFSPLEAQIRSSLV